MVSLPKTEESFWRQFYTSTVYQRLNDDIEVDVAIIGAGITGLTSAYLLKKTGLNVAVVEKDTIGGGTTGRTTGKVTSQHSLLYEDISSRLGDRTAKAYASANQAAVEKVADIIKTEKIACDWSIQDNYVFTAKQDEVQKFKEEAHTAATLGLPASFVTNTPLPFEIKGAVKFAGQGRINAQRYVLGLAEAVNNKGSFVFEHSEVIIIRDGSPAKIKTRHGSVIAKDIIVATNVPTFPLPARGGYCLMEYPTESYIIAGKSKVKLEGMYISPDDEHYSILPVEADGQKILFIGGGGHISGLRLGKHKHYRKLADYAEQHFGMNEVLFAWSDRDYTAYDGIPLVGKLYPWSKHLFVASAFRKWGLSNGTAAATILSDIITSKTNDWAFAFNSSRPGPIKSIPRVAAQYITGRH